MMIDRRARSRLEKARRPARRMMQPVLCAVLACAAGIAFEAAAASVALHQDFVTASIARRLFTDNGRRILTGSIASCGYVYLDSPKATLKDGRLFLRMRLTGHAGVSARGACVGAGDSF